MRSLGRGIAELSKYKTEVKKLAKTYGLILAILVVLFLFNYFLLFHLSHPENWLARVELSRLYFLEGVNPYDIGLSDLISRSDIINNIDGEINIFPFISPVFALYLYFPFSLIRNPVTSFSIWLTINQALLALAVYWMFDILSWKIEQEEKIFFVAFIMLANFSILNYLMPSTSILQFFFFITGIKAINKGDNIQGGIFLAMMLISPAFILLLFVLLLLNFIRNRNIIVIAWIGIILLLLCLSGIVMDSNWLLKMFRNLLNLNQKNFIYSYEAIIHIIPPGLRHPYIRYIIPLFLISWLLYEFIYSNSEMPIQQFWLLGLTICINTLIFFHNVIYLSPFFAFVFVLIFYLWHQRMKKKSMRIFFILSGVVFDIIPLLISSFYRDINDVLLTTMQSVTTLFLVIMLYWVKWWVYHNQYILNNPEDLCL